MKKIALVLLIVLPAFVGCNKSDKDEQANKYLLEAANFATVSRDQAMAGMTGTYAQLAPLVQSGYDIVRVRYRTRYNKDLILSALCVIPSEVSPNAPILVHHHGTMGGSFVPPSESGSSDFSTEAAVAYASASILKYVTLMPDYIGYGTSASTVHPYVHAESLAQASLDLIRAYAEYAEINPQTPSASKKLLLTGYSEGAYAALALCKKVQEEAPDLDIIKTYAGAGPYDVEYFMKEIFERDEELSPLYLSSCLWALLTYKNCMSENLPFSEIFSESDNTTLAAANYELGYLKTYNINRNPQQLFKRSFMDAVTNGTSELSNIIKQNTLTEFVPADSVIFFHSEADTWVYVENTLNAYEKMISKGAPVRAVIIPAEQNLDHDAAIVSFLQSTFINMYGL